jgi:beta-mannosidase
VRRLVICRIFILFLIYAATDVYGRDTNAKNTWLVFNGLDTFTTINFCEKFVGMTNNQFRQYTFDVSHILESCKTEPTLSIEFGSAPTIAQQLSEQVGQERKQHIA